MHFGKLLFAVSLLTSLSLTSLAATTAGDDQNDRALKLNPLTSLWGADHERYKCSEEGIASLANTLDGKLVNTNRPKRFQENVDLYGIDDNYVAIVTRTDSFISFKMKTYVAAYRIENGNCIVGKMQLYKVNNQTTRGVVLEILRDGMK